MNTEAGRAEAGKIDWSSVDRVLVIKLRSIGDTVLATPSLIALRHHLPSARIDILLEKWVAPLLDGFEVVDEVLTVGNTFTERLSSLREIRRRRYDVVLNLHGGTTATLLSGLSKARHRVGFSNYQYSFLFNNRVSSPVDFWGRSAVHSAEQQLALLGSVGVPVRHTPRSRLHISESALGFVRSRLSSAGIIKPFVLLHPTTAFFTKQWPVRSFARTAEFIESIGLSVVAVGSKAEKQLLEELKKLSAVRIRTFPDMSLPQITALASEASLFVGNDSGIAHIAAAVNTPSVVIFGSSNRDHWRPWTHAPNEIVFTELHCQPCPGYVCKEYGDSRCIRDLPVAAVIDAIKRVLAKEKAGPGPPRIKTKET